MAGADAACLSVADFDFALPENLVAQRPAVPRDAARLLRVRSGGLEDHVVRALPGLLRAGDLLVVNDTRVIPAQLAAMRGRARIGLTLDRPLPDGTWHALARNARRLAAGDQLSILGAEGFEATVVACDPGGALRLRFRQTGDAFEAALRQAGRLALPPYIARPDGPTTQDQDDYQTTFARTEGAVAAPTAGLHFTPGLLASLDAAGIGQATLTLHVGAGTFLPMRGETVGEHRLHAERAILTSETADRINQVRASGGRIVAVGTTTLRTLESAIDQQGYVHPYDGETDIFILPGRRILSADLLLTNFHLPRSTLFMLVCAFAGTAVMRQAYVHAIEAGYRFYSYGDATLLERA